MLTKATGEKTVDLFSRTGIYEIVRACNSFEFFLKSEIDLNTISWVLNGLEKHF